MKFFLAIHKDDDSDFGVTVPDLPGCFSAGDTIEDAMDNAKEAIACQLEAMLMDGEHIPAQLSLDEHQRNEAFDGAVWAIVAIDVATLSGKAKRVNVTIPENILNRIDVFAEHQKATRSGLLTEAALDYINRNTESRVS